MIGRESAVCLMRSPTFLLNQASFSTAYGALAFADARTLLDALDSAGALDLEGFGANRSALHATVGDVRPYPGLQSTLVRLRGLLAGSEVEARALQDPLSFRTLAQLNGAARDAFGFVGAQIAIELNAAQSRPRQRCCHLRRRRTPQSAIA